MDALTIKVKSSRIHFNVLCPINVIVFAAEMLFSCPKTCGFCENGKFCEDFYLSKCITWKNQGMCGQPDIDKKCMKSCEKCR